MNDSKKSYAYLSLALTETIAIFWFSVQPSAVFVNTGGFLRPGDLEHFAAYLVYGFFWAGSFRLFAKVTGRKSPEILLFLIVPLLIGSLVGASCETLQLFVPGRTADLLDWANDTTASFLGAITASKVKNLF